MLPSASYTYATRSPLGDHAGNQLGAGFAVSARRALPSSRATTIWLTPNGVHSPNAIRLVSNTAGCAGVSPALLQLIEHATTSTLLARRVIEVTTLGSPGTA